MVKSNRDPGIDPPNIELRIPVKWVSPAAFGDALDRSESAYRLDDEALVHRQSGWKCECGASPHDDELVEIFAHEGRLKYKELKEIDAHTAKIHLIGPGGSKEAARAMMDAASAIINAGAAGVMVDNSGVTHGRNDWLKLASDTTAGGLYWAWVNTTRESERRGLFSMGMHCLGLRDAELFGAPSEDVAWQILHNFLGFTFASGKTVIDGEPVDDPELSMFRAHAEPCTRVPPGGPFFNPYGVWRMEFSEEEQEQD
jgi:hypothetical protein